MGIKILKDIEYIMMGVLDDGRPAGLAGTALPICICLSLCYPKALSLLALLIKMSHKKLYN